jgi:N-acyl-D-aspartate/D-glutamate deacylase
MPTFMLSYWARDRQRGERLPVELLVKKLTTDTASLYGLHDRGAVSVGMRADLNVIDFDRLRVLPPELVHDLPANGRRLVQRSEGYVATIVNGTVVMRDGEETGARPGVLVRGPQRA